MKREITGVLSKKELKNLRLGYEISSSKKLNPQQGIVIQYLPRRGPIATAVATALLLKKNIDQVKNK